MYTRFFLKCSTQLTFAPIIISSIRDMSNQPEAAPQRSVFFMLKKYHTSGWS